MLAASTWPLNAFESLRMAGDARAGGKEEHLAAALAGGAAEHRAAQQAGGASLREDLAGDPRGGGARRLREALADGSGAGAAKGAAMELRMDSAPRFSQRFLMAEV